MAAVESVPLRGPPCLQLPRQGPTAERERAHFPSEAGAPRVWRVSGVRSQPTGRVFARYRGSTGLDSGTSLPSSSTSLIGWSGATAASSVRITPVLSGACPASSTRSDHPLTLSNQRRAPAPYGSGYQPPECADGSALWTLSLRKVMTMAISFHRALLRRRGRPPRYEPRTCLLAAFLSPSEGHHASTRGASGIPALPVPSTTEYHWRGLIGRERAACRADLCSRDAGCERQAERAALGVAVGTPGRWRRDRRAPSSLGDERVAASARVGTEDR